MPKIDTLTPEHLTWLVESRYANQRAAVRLFNMFETHSTKVRSKGSSTTSQRMVSVCFSLWRAAFLSDKTGKRSAVVDDAKTFLGKMLTDNAITYPQDRSTREWTFNYYIVNAESVLLKLAVDWKDIQDKISEPRKFNKTRTVSMTRWNRYHDAFVIAIDCFEQALREAPEPSAKKRKLPRS
jgi:hypothetical protein